MKEDLSNKRDRELDEFFREKSEKPDVPFDPSDWEKMAARLDQKCTIIQCRFHYDDK